MGKNCCKQLWESLKDAPKTSSPCHIILFIVNIFFSGCGTMCASCSCCNKKKSCESTQFLWGLFECLFAWLIIPWILSVIGGYFIFKEGQD